MNKHSNWSPNNSRIKNSCYKGYIAVDNYDISVRELKRNFIKKHGTDGIILSDVIKDSDISIIKDFYKCYTYRTIEECIKHLSFVIYDFNDKYRAAKLNYIESI